MELKRANYLRFYRKGSFGFFRAEENGWLINADN